MNKSPILANAWDKLHGLNKNIFAHNFKCGSQSCRYKNIKLDLKKKKLDSLSTSLCLSVSSWSTIHSLNKHIKTHIFRNNYPFIMHILLEELKLSFNSLSLTYTKVSWLNTKSPIHPNSQKWDKVGYEKELLWHLEIMRLWMSHFLLKWRVCVCVCCCKERQMQMNANCN